MKNIYKFAIVLALVFGGCSTKSGFFAEDEMYQSALMHSKKGEIFNSLELKASIIATHLNSFLEECKKCSNEQFLVAIYIDNDSSDKEKQGIKNSFYTLTLNSKKPLNVKPLSYDDDLIKLAPFRNRWAKYYLIDFAKDDKDRLEMEYKSKSFGSANLIFSK